MTNGIVFVLHSPAGAGYATELAQALSPYFALPVAIDEAKARPTQFGAGAMCVVLWSRDLETTAAAGMIAAATPQSSTVLCRSGNAGVPHEFAGVAVVDVQATVDATGAALRDVIARKQLETTERSGRPRRAAPSFASQAPVREAGKHRLVVRSAWGLAASMAVVSVAAPVISDRAGAANIVPEADPRANDAVATSTTTTVAMAEQAPVEEFIQISDGAITAAPQRDSLELLVRPSPVEVVATFAAVHEVDLPDAVIESIVLGPSGLDADTADIIAGMAAGSDVSEWKIELSAPAPDPVAQSEKPETARAPSKFAS